MAAGASPEPKVRCLHLSSIRQDGKTQQRFQLDVPTVDEYASLMREGAVFPPVRVWWDGGRFWLADGFHRIAAAQKVGLSEILAEIRYGALSDAQWDSYSANA